MVSMVAANKPNKYMSFKHLGEVKDGLEDRSSDKIKEWAGAMEKYTQRKRWCYGTGSGYGYSRRVQGYVYENVAQCIR